MTNKRQGRVATNKECHDKKCHWMHEVESPFSPVTPSTYFRGAFNQRSGINSLLLMIEMTWKCPNHDFFNRRSWADDILHLHERKYWSNYLMWSQKPRLTHATYGSEIRPPTVINGPRSGPWSGIWSLWNVSGSHDSIRFDYWFPKHQLITRGLFSLTQFARAGVRCRDPQRSSVNRGVIDRL